MKNWRNYAACLGLNDAMFPEPTDYARIRAARTLCAACPARKACLIEAMAAEGASSRNNRHGVRAGLTPGQRYGRWWRSLPEEEQQRRKEAAARRKARRKQTAAQKEQFAAAREKRASAARSLNPCGTDTAYNRHVRNREPIDEACREAHRVEAARYRTTGTRKVAACGSNSGYAKHLRDKTPICEPCRQAHREADWRLKNTGTTKVAA